MLNSRRLEAVRVFGHYEIQLAMNVARYGAEKANRRAAPDHWDDLAVPETIDDINYPAVRKVLGFVETDMKYNEIDVGLKKNMKGRNLLVTAIRLMLGRCREDRYFKKMQDWQPSWDFY